MSEQDTQLALIAQKLDLVLDAQAEMKVDMRSLRNEHQQLQLTVTGLGFEHLKEAEARFAPLGRLVLLERVFYGVVGAALIGAIGLLARDLILEGHADTFKAEVISGP